MAYREFVSLIHKSTKRDYLARVTERDKAEVAEMAIQFDYDYWDGSRQTGYGGYRYDGRWRKVADAMIAAYGIKPGMRVLDVGSGKGFLLHDFTRSVSRRRGRRHRHFGLCDRAHDGRREAVRARATPRKLPWPDRHFDLVISITTLHNLYLPALVRACRRSSGSAAARNIFASRPIATSARR